MYTKLIDSRRGLFLTLFSSRAGLPWWLTGKESIYRPNETEKLLHSKGNSKQGEKTALRLGENNSKRSNRQKINLKNIQATPPAQLQKNK